MCFLCMRSSLPEPGPAATERAKLLAKAALLKLEIRQTEEMLDAAVDIGMDPCPNVREQLSEMKRQQYELAQKI